MLEIALADEAATEALGAALADVLSPGMRVYLNGQLGAGKTTLVRGLLHALGHVGPVRSPTYALVESYALSRFTAHHFDLYRLADPEELEFIGIRDFITDDAVCLIEWPERAAGLLPEATVNVELRLSGRGRVARLRGGVGEGARALAALHIK
ncbi:tRNA (adenosine(37)-N6)-threonylcarbamoyltransferase complex ATPase subunit type 1 TsaE [Acidihalobacter ferrooxydans]|uniref:tRNA threonylcarbamoyladenosine biosynthesis protein TsaE n=2 Tax=Acidihalobacter ferrooxydans TaxID=1765967 RepID=A0A1P8UI92_9GAMM|nr:tRNA (adenosine(37)-N6)-threonylcarbamoyltransferase complex ATPase subunit type 1 TsaE [Acidihalobacter ferrooxydans]